MAKTLYNWPADNLMPYATITTPTGTVVAAFPAANLRDLSPANPLKFSTATARIVFDFGSAITVYLIALLHHNLEEGLSVAIEANASDSWGSPTYSQALTIGAIDNYNYRANCYRNLTGTAAHGAYRYWSLRMLSANDVNISIGEIWLSSVIRELPVDMSWGFDADIDMPGRKVLITRAGVEHVSAAVGKQRTLVASIDNDTAGLAAVKAWSDACAGMDRPTLIVPGDGFPLDQTEPWLVKWTNDFKLRGEFLARNRMAIGFRECARGAAYPTA